MKHFLIASNNLNFQSMPIFKECLHKNDPLCLISCQLRAVGFQHADGRIDSKAFQAYFTEKKYREDIWTNTEAKVISFLSGGCSLEANNNKTDKCRRANLFSDCLHRDLNKEVERMEQLDILNGKEPEMKEEDIYEKVFDLSTDD